MSPTRRNDATDLALAERRHGEAKGSINLRIDASARRLIDEAAAALGKTRTEFMLDAARQAAVDVVLDQRLFTLDSTRYDAFVQALETPPAPGARLKGLFKRKPVWTE